MLVITVQYGGLRYALVGRARQHREELALRLQIFLKRAVEIEVLRRKIGEDRDVDLGAAELS